MSEYRRSTPVSTESHGAPAFGSCGDHGGQVQRSSVAGMLEHETSPVNIRRRPSPARAQRPPTLQVLTAMPLSPSTNEGLTTKTHPLDQLTSEEVRTASHVCKAQATALGIFNMRFISIMLVEPPKADLLAWQLRATNARLPARMAQVIMIAPKAGMHGAALEARVQLAPLGHEQAWSKLPPTPSLVMWEELPGVQPMTTPCEGAEAELIMKADPELTRLVRERYGLSMDSVCCDGWALHNGPKDLQGRRMLQGFMYAHLLENDNEYAHPLDLVPIVDLNAGRIIRIDKYERAPSLPTEGHEYHRDLMKIPLRTGLRPLHLLQPQGPSFLVDGNLVKWQNWQVRVGFNGREGLVLHQVGWEERGKLRPILHRASLVEMIVPYGDPHEPYTRKSAMDIGDYGLGFSANSLELGCDCLGHIKYFDAVVNDSRGEPRMIRKAVCMHEEDAGIMQKHFDVRTGHVETRRGRRLVISSISTFSNYEYCMYWYLYLDGSIGFEIKLTGILSTSIAPVGEHVPAHGVRLGPGVNATLHQHMFCARLDPAIDDLEGGKAVVVSELSAVALPPGPMNPAANGFRLEETDYTRTDTARGNVDFGAARCWKLKNPSKINPVSKEAISYRLIPGPTPQLMAQEGSMVRARGNFATHNVWVTPHHDEQRFPAGEHTVSSTECLGLAKWTAQDQSLVNADPVVYYSFGVTHIPRVEDFPIMPAESATFMLKPASFFTCNPALDVPHERDTVSVEACCKQPLPLSRL
mmetsp:Transcript_22578/g.38518  ORF Transcript_22578/g.38518 Transcript_22578/m.38518 type:complete len:752 (-) Transcript_22578:1328-3583(-)